MQILGRLARLEVKDRASVESVIAKVRPEKRLEDTVHPFVVEDVGSVC